MWNVQLCRLLLHVMHGLGAAWLMDVAAIVSRWRGSAVQARGVHVVGVHTCRNML